MLFIEMLHLVGTNWITPSYFLKGWHFILSEEIYNILILEGLVLFLSLFFNIFEYVNFWVIVVLIVLTRRLLAGGVCLSQKQLNGQVIIITGSNTGIGKETARDLGERGAEIVMACRDTKKAERAAEELRIKIGCKVTVFKLDLSSLASVKEFAEEIKENYSAVDCLINNAGVMMCPYTTTADGFEMQFGTNHMGHFYLTKLLLPLLYKAQSARVVTVSSAGHWPIRSKFTFDDLNYSKGYNSLNAYSVSKLANILFTRHLATIVKGSSIKLFSLHPGVVQSELGRHLPFGLSIITSNFASLFGKTTREGAQTTIYCATDADQDPNYYFSDCVVGSCSPAAKNDRLAEQLWDVSEELLAQKLK